MQSKSSGKAVLIFIFFKIHKTFEITIKVLVDFQQKNSKAIKKKFSFINLSDA